MLGHGDSGAPEPDFTVSAGTHVRSGAGFQPRKEDLEDATLGINYTAPGISSPVQEVMVDFHSDIDDIRRQFKDRYNKLKAIYEDRLQTLSQQVRDTQQALLEDEAIAAMKERNETSPFIFERAQEIVEASLDMERERSFQALAKDFAKKDADIKHLKRQNERLQVQLENALREAEEVAPLRMALKKAEHRVHVAEQQIKTYLEQRGEEAKEVETAINTLRQSMGGERVNLTADVAKDKQQTLDAFPSAGAFAWESFTHTPSVERRTNHTRENLLNQVVFAEKKLRELDMSEGKVDGQSIEEVKERLIEELSDAQENLLMHDRRTRANKIERRVDDAMHYRVNRSFDAPESLTTSLHPHHHPVAPRNTSGGVMRGAERKELEAHFERRLEQTLEERNRTEGLLRRAHADMVDRLNADIDKSNQKYTSLKEKTKTLKVELKRTKQELAEHQSLLQESEKERLEIRNKYLSIGKKMETIVTSEQEDMSRLEEKYREKLKRAKAKLLENGANAKDLVRNHRQKVSELRKALEMKQQEISDMKLQHQQELHEHKTDNEGTLKILSQMEVALANANEKISVHEGAKTDLISLRTELDMAKLRLQDEPRRLEEAVRQRSETYERRISEMQVEIAKLEGEMKLQRSQQGQTKAQIEIAQERHVAEVKEELQQKYQGLIEAKLKELAAAQSDAREMNAKAKAREDKLREQVNRRLSDIQKDYITQEQHEEILRTKLNELRSELKAKYRSETVRKQTNMSAQLSDKGRELETNFRVAENRMQQQIVTLEREKAEAVEQKIQLENQNSSDRKMLVEFQERVQQEKQVNEKLVNHLEEASQNIGHLTQMVEAETSRAENAEQSLEEANYKCMEVSHRCDHVKGEYEHLLKENEVLLNRLDEAQRRVLIMLKVSSTDSYAEKELIDTVAPAGALPETSSPVKRRKADVDEVNTRRGLAERVAIAEMQLVEHDTNADKDIDALEAKLRDEEIQLTRIMEDAKQAIAMKKEDEAAGLTSDDEKTVEAHIRRNYGEIKESIEQQLKELELCDEEIKQTTHAHDNTPSNEERLTMREKLADLRTQRHDTKRDIEELNTTLFNHQVAIRNSIIAGKERASKKAEEDYFLAKAVISSHFAKSSKALEDLKTKKNEERKFLRGRFLAAVTDLKAHDKATTAGVIMERKQALLKQTLQKRSDTEKALTINVTKTEETLISFKKQSSIDMEELKKKGTAYVEMIRVRREDAAKTLAAYEAAIEDSVTGGGGSEFNLDDTFNFSESGVADPERRKFLEDKVKQIELELTTAKAKFEKEEEIRAAENETRKKNYEKRLSDAHNALAEYNEKVAREDKEEQAVLMKLIHEHEFDVCNRFIGTEETCSTILEKQVYTLTQTITEKKAAMLSMVADIHDTTLRLQVSSDYELGLNALQNSLSEAKIMLERHTNERHEVASLLDPYDPIVHEHDTVDKEYVDSPKRDDINENDFQLPISTKSRSAPPPGQKMDGASLVEARKHFHWKPVGEHFSILTRNISRIKHALMSETARRKVLQKAFEKRVEEIKKLEDELKTHRSQTSGEILQVRERSNELKNALDMVETAKRENEKLELELGDARNRFNRTNLKFEQLLREKSKLEKTISRHENSARSFLSERDELKLQLASQAREHGDALRLLQKNHMEAKSSVAEKQDALHKLRESTSMTRMRTTKLLRTTIQTTKEQISKLRIQSTAEIDHMRNDIYKYVREMQFNFRSVLSTIHATNQRDNERAMNELKTQFGVDSQRLNAAHREEILRIQEMHTSALNNMEKRINSTQKSTDSERERFEASKAAQLEEQMAETNSLQLQNSELRHSLSTAETKLTHLKAEWEAANDEKGRLGMQLSTLTKELHMEEKSREDLKASMRKLEEEHRAEMSKMARQNNNYVGTLISLAANIDIPQSVQDCLLSEDQATYSVGLTQLHEILQEQLASHGSAHQKRAVEEATTAAAELKDKLDSALRVHESDVSALQGKIQSLEQELRRARMETSKAEEETKVTRSELALEKQESRVLKSELEQAKSVARLEVENVKSLSHAEVEKVKSSLLQDAKLSESQMRATKESMEKELELEKMKLREERARRMAELDQEKAAIQLQMEAQTRRFEEQVRQQQEALKAQAEAQRKEMAQRREEYELLNRMALESSRSELNTEAAVNTTTLRRLEMENRELKERQSALQKSSLAESNAHLEAIKARHEEEVSKLKKKVAVDHRKMRILRSELAQQAEEADRLISAERSKLSTVLSRHSAAESRIAALTQEMNDLKSSVANIQGDSRAIQSRAYDDSPPNQSHVHITRQGSVYVDTGHGESNESRLTMENLHTSRR